MPGVDYDMAMLTAYERGWLDGLWAYAWWKDGRLYVGTAGRTYEDAVREFLRENNPAALREDQN